MPIQKDPEKCVCPGCPNKATHKFSVRVFPMDEETPNWNPHPLAVLCEKHAKGGGFITIFFEPSRDRIMRYRLIAARRSQTRAYRIKEK
jgi:hypothetical protein